MTTVKEMVSRIEKLRVSSTPPFSLSLDHLSPPHQISPHTIYTSTQHPEDHS